MSIIELMDPFGKDSGPVGAGNVETEGSANISLIPFGAVWVCDLIMFNLSLQHLDLGIVSNCLPIVGFLGLVDSADSFAQYSSESGSIKDGDITEEGIQEDGRHRDWGWGRRSGNLAIVLAAGVGGFLSGHNSWAD